MPRFFSLPIILAASLLIPVPVLGEQTPSETEVLETTETKEIVVTASRYEEVLSSVPANVSIITEEDIKNSTAQNIPDLLRNQPGVQVNDINGSRRAYTVDLRGFGETAPLNTLVLVDGRRVNQADLSGVDWAQISLDRVQRIEIIRGGSGAVLYGDNASGGVVNIITKEGEKFKAGAGLGLGSYDTAKGNAYVSGSLKSFSYVFSGSYLTSAGYRDNSDTRARDAGMNLGYAAGERFRLGVSGGYHKDKTGLPGAIKKSDFAAGASRTDTLNPNDFAEVEDYYLQAVPEVYFGDNSFFRVDGSYRKRNSDSFATFALGDFQGNSEIETIALSPQIVFKNQIAGIQNNLIAGFDNQDSHEDIVNTSTFLGIRTKGAFELKKENYGIYVHEEIKPINILTVSAGYRHDWADFSFAPSTPDQTSVNEDAYSVGINYQYAGKSYAYGSYNRSFRYPVLDELFSFFTNTIDTGLDPQRSDDYEAGTRFYFSDDFYVHANLFWIDTEKEIFFNPSTFANENLDGETRRRGIEISGSVKTFSWMTVGGSYTYTDAKIRGGDFDGNDIPNVPKHKASLTAEIFPAKGFVVAVSGNYVGERPFVSDFPDSFSDQDDYYVFNARLRYNWRFLAAFLDINNIADKEYSEYGVLGGFPLEKAFYPSPERNFLAGVTVSL